MPQLHGQYEGDRSRKETLIEHGFRLPSAADNRPLRFEEFYERVNQCVFLSATPSAYEIQQSTCCLAHAAPALADLPGALREMLEAVRPGWVFVEAPALAAAGFMAEFDRVFGWPRELAVCLDPGWTAALREDALSPFQLALLQLADRVVPNAAPTGAQRGSPATSHDPA